MTPRASRHRSETLPMPGTLRMGRGRVKSRTASRVKGTINWPSGLLMSEPILASICKV
jgi:hypothetical protein